MKTIAQIARKMSDKWCGKLFWQLVFMTSVRLSQFSWLTAGKWFKSTFHGGLFTLEIREGSKGVYTVFLASFKCVCADRLENWWNPGSIAQLGSCWKCSTSTSIQITHNDFTTLYCGTAKVHVQTASNCFERILEKYLGPDFTSSSHEMTAGLRFQFGSELRCWRRFSLHNSPTLDCWEFKTEPDADWLSEADTDIRE